MCGSCASTSTSATLVVLFFALLLLVSIKIHFEHLRIASSAWAPVSQVKDSLRNDPRYKSVRHEDRELFFNEYISELKASEEEIERVEKAKRDEQEKLKERDRESRKRKEREEQEMERVRLKVRRKEAVSSYQALLVETIKDPKASWIESKLKLEKDPRSHATNPDLSLSDMEKLFRDHVRDLYEMVEIYSKKADLSGYTPLGSFNSAFSFTPLKKIDVAVTKSLAMDGMFIPLCKFQMVKQPSLLREDVRHVVPHSGEPSSLISEIH